MSETILYRKVAEPRDFSLQARDLHVFSILRRLEIDFGRFIDIELTNFA